MGFFSSLGFGRRKFDYNQQYSVAQTLGRKTVVWADVTNSHETYQEVPQIKTVIDRKASMFANLKWKLVDSDNAEVEDADLMDLLSRPNPMQNGKEWITDWKTVFEIHQDAYTFGNFATPLSSLPATLWTLPTEDIEMVQTGKLYFQTKAEDIVSMYILKTGDPASDINFEPNTILHCKAGNAGNPIKGQSKMLALKMPISNIMGAYKSRNILINERGAFGILSNNSKDASGGGIPMNKKESERIEKDYMSSHGIQDGKKRFIISNASLSFTPMSFPTKDLMLFEEIDDDMKTIIDAYGLNTHLFSSVKGSTFENMIQGIRNAYTGTIIPEAELFAEKLTSFLKLDDRGLKLVASFDHIHALQANRVEQSEALLNWARAVEIVSNPENGVIMDSDQRELIVAQGLGII